MAHFELVDYLTMVAMALNVLNVYIAYALTRVTGGAPKGWYLIVGAFALLFGRNAFQLYLDVNIHNFTLGDEHEIVSVAVQILFSAGLYLLLQTFRSHLKLAKETASVIGSS